MTKWCTAGLLVLTAVALPLSAHKHAWPQNWETGTVLESARSRETRGGGNVAIATSSSSSGNDSNPSVNAATQMANNAAMLAAAGAARPRYIDWQGFIVQGPVYKYTVMCPISRNHKPNVTVNGPIRYGVQKGIFFLMDEDGNVFEMDVLEKALPAPAKPGEHEQR